MKYRTYPGTDITVSEVGFGLWTLAAGWWGDFTDAEAIALLHRAHDLGVTLFDSSDTYGNGRADELLARALRGRRVVEVDARLAVHALREAREIGA